MRWRFFSVLACAALVACAVIEQFTNELTLTLSREATVFVPDPAWSSGDAVKVLSSTRKSGQSFALSAGARTATGTFRGEKPGSAPFLLLWPASAQGEYVSGSELGLQLPAEQQYVKDGFDASACPFAASVEGSETATLRCPMAVLELSVTGDATLAALTIQTPEDHPLCGSASLRFGGTPALHFKSGASNTLTLSCGSGVKLSKKATAFRFVLPPEALSSGADLVLTDAEGGAMRCSLASVSLEAGSVVPVPAIAYEQQEPPFLNQSIPGLYTVSASGKVTAIYAYESLRDQIGLIETADALEWRLQCLEDGKVLRVQLPLKRDKTFAAQFSAIGVSACPAGSVTLHPVQVKDGLEWLLDASGSTLLILSASL